jgi:hypothetical protein
MCGKVRSHAHQSVPLKNWKPSKKLQTRFRLGTHATQCCSVHTSVQNSPCRDCTEQAPRVRRQVEKGGYSSASQLTSGRMRVKLFYYGRWWVRERERCRGLGQVLAPWGASTTGSFDLSNSTPGPFSQSFYSLRCCLESTAERVSHHQASIRICAPGPVFSCFCAAFSVNEP